MKVYLVGNSIVRGDNLPFRILPHLQKAFPQVLFEYADPNENFIPEEGSVIIDTVKGIANVQQFDDIDHFVVTKSVSPHDYDLGFHLKLLFKLKKISRVTILGVPQNGNPVIVINRLSVYLRQLTENGKNEGEH